MYHTVSPSQYHHYKELHKQPQQQPYMLHTLNFSVVLA